MSVFGKIRHLFDGTYSREDVLIRVCGKLGIHPREYRLLKWVRRAPRSSDMRYIPLKTYDGSGQATHPDVLWDGGRWVMALTPYPRSNDKFENPCVYTSPDGRRWTPIKETYPLVGGYAEEGKYNSDPDIVFYGGKYELFWRVHTTYPQIENAIYSVMSEDLHTWSEPTLIFKSEGYQVLSPAALVRQGKRILFWVEDRDETFRLVRYDVDTQSRTEIALDGVPEGRTLWHLDVSDLHGQTVAVITMGTYRHMNTKNYIAVLRDDVCRIVCEVPIDESWAEDIYRASLVERDGTFHAYTSIKSKHRQWYLYDVDVTEQVERALHEKMDI